MKEYVRKRRLSNALALINPYQNEYNRCSWLVGEKHFAVATNNEVRYAAVNFPYVRSDFGLLPAHPIVIGSNGNALYIRSFIVTQLKYTPKIRVKKERFNVFTKQSNNILPNIRVLNRGDNAENHEFCGAAAYVMECIGDTVIGTFAENKNERLWFFEGLTGDILTQVYSFTGHQGWARSDYLFSKTFIEGIFDKCGYASTFISPEEFDSNRAMYVQTITAYIDKGVPVIFAEAPYNGECRVICGYENYGQTLLFLHGSNTKEINKLAVTGSMQYAWVFVGEKRCDIDIASAYRQMIYDLPEIFEQKTDTYCFGPSAFAAWADEIERAGYESGGVYEILLLTILAAVRHIFDKVIALNPDMAWVAEVHDCYKQSEHTWNQNGWDEGETDAEKNQNRARIQREVGKYFEDAVAIIKARR